MNRETKVGLLAGLVLIVLVGALLSNYLSRPRQDQISTPANTMDDGLRQGLTDSDAVPPAQDMGGQDTTTGTSVSGPAAPTSVQQSAPIQGSREPNQGSVASETTTGASNAQITGAGSQTQSILRSNLPLNVPQTTMVADDGGTLMNNATQAQINTPPGNVYTVVAGDSLSRIARKFYHSSGPAAINRILHANSEKLSGRESTLQVGEKLVIPGLTAAPAAVAAAQESSIPMPSNYAESNNPSTANLEKSSGTTYQVKQGDTLYSITRRFLGAASKSNIKLIMQANHLHNADSLIVGQTLHIPSR
ncbi:MAG TPA: LysM peptidoglycan-binding domain-containing protein [Phycisphaerae bacterium]|nr:LysM peptidoglycan-binding domain-containing protein [Phycisphaerae bacterium]